MPWNGFGALPPCGPGRKEPKSCERTRHERFEDIWRLHLPELFRRSLAWTNGCREDAEDALAEAAISAFQKLPPELDPEGARRWLVHLTYTKCMDIHRKRRQVRRHFQDSASPETVALLDERSPESTALESELAALVQERILRMPLRLRSVAELYLLREMGYPEIAATLGITQVNARKRLQEVRGLLRGLLRAYQERGADPLPAAEAEGAAPRESPRAAAEPLWSTGALRAYIRKHPRGWKKRWELAVRLRREGELEEAAGLLREALERNPLQAGLALELGEVLTALGREEEALEVWRAALRRTPDEADRERLEQRIATGREPRPAPG